MYKLDTQGQCCWARLNRLGLGTVPGRTQGVLDDPWPTRALAIPWVEGDGWRLQAGEEVGLATKGPLLLVGHQFLLTRSPAGGRG